MLANSVAPPDDSPDKRVMFIRVSGRLIPFTVGISDRWGNFLGRPAGINLQNGGAGSAVIQAC